MNNYNIESMLGYYGTIEIKFACASINKLSRGYRRLLGLPFEHASENNYFNKNAGLIQRYKHSH